MDIAAAPSRARSSSSWTRVEFDVRCWRARQL